VIEKPIRLMVADVDGTLVTQDKELTPRAIAAVQALGGQGVRFAVTSGRPPRGMAMLVDPLALDTPISAFNGGVVVDPKMQILEQKTLDKELVLPTIELMASAGLDVWLYSGSAWYVQDPKGPHVDREAWTVKFQPTVTDSYDDLTDAVAKLVGVSDDHDKVAAAAGKVKEKWGDEVTSATSQPYYLDVTHPDANKGFVVRYLAAKYGLSPDEICTIGDMPNDERMFTESGLTIAMGNAEDEVKTVAHEVTDTNEDDGFAKAVERFVLPRAPGPST
jgi:Cof subfamily protein (haloacid dehalogenase superfamily)